MLRRIPQYKLPSYKQRGRRSFDRRPHGGPERTALHPIGALKGPRDIRESIRQSITRLPDLLAEVPRPRTERFFRLDDVLHVVLELELVVARLRQRRRRRLVRPP